MNKKNNTPPPNPQSALNGENTFKDGDYLTIEEVKKYLYYEIKFHQTDKKHHQAYLKTKDIPNTMQRAYAENDVILCLTAPDTYFIACPKTHSYRAFLEKHHNPQTVSLSDLSHAITQIRITGKQVTDLLERTVAIDVHESQFPNHAYAQTQYHHVKITLYKINAQDIRIYIPRSFARSLTQTLNQSARIIKKSRIINEKNGKGNAYGA